jgi:acyl-CoA thioester hydrolase
MKKKNIFKINDFSFFYTINTRFRDIDAFNHVNNAVFLSYFEDARKIFFDRWSVNLKEKSLIVASIRIDYFNQLEHPSSLKIGQKIIRIGHKSFDILSVLFYNDTAICVATTTVVCYNFVLQKTVLVFDEIKKDLNI